MVEELENTVKAVLDHMETALDTKRVVGEPIQVGEYTIVLGRVIHALLTRIVK